MLILYHPQSSAQRKPLLPLSLLALGARLEGRHDYVIVDGNLDWRAHDRIVEMAQGGGERSILAVTVMPGPQLRDAVTLCRRLRREIPRTRVIWGGYFPTQHAAVCLESGLVDHVVRGHGDDVFPALLDDLIAGRQVPAATDLAPLPDPNALPLYPYHRVDVPRYVRPTFLGSRTLSHHSSYGCPFRCNFCAVVNLAKGRWKGETPERLLRVVDLMIDRWRIDGIEFFDNNFFVDEDRVAAFAEGMAHRAVGWWGEARVDRLLAYRDRTWDLMRRSGLKMVFMGAESGSDEALEQMNKGGRARAEATIELVRRMASHGVVPELSFVLGLPPDPEADVDRAIGFIRRVKRANPATEIVFYVYTPVPLAGRLLSAVTAAGFRFPQTLDEWVSDEGMAFVAQRSQLPWIPPRALRRLRDFEKVLNAYYPTTTDLRLRGWRRALLRLLGAWRYATGITAYPVELRLAQRVFSYRRPETASF